jgi:hypothetical protein
VAGPVLPLVELGNRAVEGPVLPLVELGNRAVEGLAPVQAPASGATTSFPSPYSKHAA